MKKHVLVLYGGHSSERDVSLRSGKNVADSLALANYEVTLADTGQVDFDLVEAVRGVDVVLPMLHGVGGEDGVLQKQLEELSVPYFGSDSTACARTFDKVACKKVLVECGILTPKWQVVTKEQFLQSPMRQAPYVLKPIVGGSSIDTLIVPDPVQGAPSSEAISVVFSHYDEMLLEELIAGQELTVGILGAEPLPVILIVPPNGETFDYENKYNGRTREVVSPKTVPVGVQKQAQELALRVHTSMGCRHMSRTDIILTPGGDMYVLELNTLPGMTSESLVPRAAAATGVSMVQLTDMMVRLVLA